MKTLILATAIKLLSPLFLIFSIYILFRGHNHPGGGFIGGLVGSIGFVFHTMTHGAVSTRKLFLLIPVYILIETGTKTRIRMLRIIAGTAMYVCKIKPKKSTLNKHTIHLNPDYILASGLFIAGASGLFSVFFGKPFMTAIWTGLEIPILGKMGTPILFDLGVYLLVMGIMFKITLLMSEE